MPKGDREILKADPEDGTAPIANLLLEALAMAHLSGEEKGAVLFLWRRTYGWQEGSRRKTEDSISLPEWAAALDTSKDYSARIVKQLVQKRIILQKDLGKGRGYTYSMNTRVNQWDRGSLDGLLLSKRYSQGLSKRYSPLPPKKTTPSDTNLATPKERLKKELKKECVHAPKLSSNPSIARMQRYLGFPEKTAVDPVPNPGKEAMFIKKMLKRGFTEEQIFKCWEDKVDDRGEFVSMVWVNEDIGKKGGSHGTHKQGSQKLPPRDGYSKPPRNPKLDKLVEQQRAADHSPGRDKPG